MDALPAAAEADLVYVSDQSPGLTRRRSGRGFSYRDAKGRAITDAATLDRIRALAIPPAWTGVWICPDPGGHLQATGRDAKGRKQYVYHPQWHSRRDESKYDKLADLARLLPALRDRIERDLARPAPSRQRVLATVVRLLETTLIRIGNSKYARSNDSYGLTTLKDEHVEVDGTRMRFEFRGKSGKTWQLSVADRRIANAVRACQELPGQHLFQYVEDGERHAITSSEVNAYLREACGADVSAKDLRTWAGTVLTAVELTRTEPAQSPSHAKRIVSAAVKRVAARLGNTPTVCRKSYVHPAVIEAYIDGRLAAAFELGAAAGERLAHEEAAVLALLSGPSEPAPDAAPPERAPTRASVETEAQPVA